MLTWHRTKYSGKILKIILLSLLPSLPSSFLTFFLPSLLVDVYFVPRTMLGTNMQYLYNKIQSPSIRNLETRQVATVYLFLSFYNRQSGTNCSLNYGAEMNLIYIPAIPKRMKLLYTCRKCLAALIMEGVLE